MAICEFSQQNLGSWHSLAQHMWEICESFSMKIVFFTNLWKFSPSKVSHYTVLLYCNYIIILSFTVNSKKCPPLTALLNAYACCILLWLSRWDCCLEEVEDGEGEGGLSDHLPPRDQHASEGQAPQHCPRQGECCGLISWPSSVLWVKRASMDGIPMAYRLYEQSR